MMFVPELGIGWIVLANGAGKVNDISFTIGESLVFIYILYLYHYYSNYSIDLISLYKINRSQHSKHIIDLKISKYSQKVLCILR